MQEAMQNKAARSNETTARASYRDEGGWFGDDLLADIALINLKTVHWLRAQVRAAGPLARQPLLAENRAAWLALDDSAAQHVASCPCVLTDAAFADAVTWRALAGEAVRDAAPAAALQSQTVWLDDPGGIQLARLTTQFGWHLARHRPVAATLTLGMSLGTAAHLQSMRLAVVDMLSEWVPSLVKPRWHDEPRVWARLLAAAMGGQPLELEAARVGTLQLIARQLGRARELENAGKSFAAPVPPR